MALQQKFRGAFNGFHREDVVNYIAQVNHDHEVQVNGLKNEMELLRQELAAEREKTAMLLEELNGIRNQTDRQRAQQELELFRQAERAQREAGEKAAQAYAKAGEILAQALEKTADSAAHADALAHALGDLQKALEAGSAELQEEGKL